MKLWTVKIRNQTPRSVQSDLDLHCPQKLLVSTSLRKELTIVIRQLWDCFKLKKLQTASFEVVKQDGNFSIC